MAAERIGLSTEAYARLERGQSLPSYPTLARICAQMDASPNALLGFHTEDVVSVSEAKPLREARAGDDDDDGDLADATATTAQREQRHTIRRLTSQLQDLEPALVDAIARLVANLWRNR